MDRYPKNEGKNNIYCNNTWVKLRFYRHLVIAHHECSYDSNLSCPLDSTFFFEEKDEVTGFFLLETITPI